MSGRPSSRKLQRQSKGFQKKANVNKAVQLYMKEHQEIKFYDIDLNSAADSTSGTLIQLNDVPQGSSSVTRDGDSLYARSLTCRFWARQTTAGAPNYIRYLIVRWNNNSTPTASQILQATGTDSCIISPKNHLNRQEYSILWDSGAIQLQQSDLSAAGDYTNQNIDYRSLLLVFPLNFKCIFSSGSINGTNRLYFLRFSDGANIGTHRMYTRFTFYDS